MSAKPRVVASIEARMTSTRLPGKALADINGVPALGRVARRLRRVRRLDDIVLATTGDVADDVLEKWAEEEGVACFRGSEDDVLGRVVEAHRAMNTDIIVEVGGDTPLTDPGLLDHAIETFLETPCDVVTNALEPSYPQGIDVEVFRLVDLNEVAGTVTDPAVREHVSLYFYEHPERYTIVNLTAPARLRAPEQRLQIDFPEDLALVREIYARLEPDHGDSFGAEEILDLLRAEPDLADINRNCREKPVR